MKAKLVTFDAFSALFDIETSIMPTVVKVLGDRLGEDALDFFRLWRKKQWEYILLSTSLKKGFLTFAYITDCALNYTAKVYGIEVAEEEKANLNSAWSSLKTWPEAGRVLEALKDKGYEIALFSNGDTDMLISMANQLPVEVDYVFSAEKAQSYKPTPEIYRLPFEETGYEWGEIIHVAGSPFDTLGAASAGIQCIWSNRKGDFLIDDTYCPNYETRNLKGILDLL